MNGLRRGSQLRAGPYELSVTLGDSSQILTVGQQENGDHLRADVGDLFEDRGDVGVGPEVCQYDRKVRNSANKVLALLIMSRLRLSGRPWLRMPCASWSDLR